MTIPWVEELPAKQCPPLRAATLHPGPSRHRRANPQARVSGPAVAPDGEGANTAVRAAAASRTQPIWPAVAVPSISPRTAVTTWVIGLTPMNARSHPGMVRGSANTLLARVRGNMITRLTLETELGARSTKPSRVQTHDTGRAP